MNKYYCIYYILFNFFYFSGNFLNFNYYIDCNNELRRSNAKLVCEKLKISQENERIKSFEEDRNLCRLMSQYWVCKYSINFQDRPFPDNELQMPEKIDLLEDICAYIFFDCCAPVFALEEFDEKHVRVSLLCNFCFLKYFIDRTYIGSGEEINENTKILEGNIGVLNLWGVDFGGSENIQDIMVYVVGLFLKRVFYSDTDSIKSAIELSAKEKWIHEFLKSEYGTNYTEDQVKKIIFEKFIPTICDSITYLFPKSSFNKVKLPYEICVDEKRKALAAFNSYEDTLELFAKKLIYLTGDPNIVSDVIDLHPSINKAYIPYVPMYFIDNLKVFFNKHFSKKL